MIFNTVIWFGSTTCDICGNEIGEYLYDGKLDVGPWATMCEECFIEHGVGLGIGKGQEYFKNPNSGEYEKING